MTSLRKLLVPALLTSALVLSGCGSTTKSSTDTASTTTESATTTVADATTTSAAATTTAPPTTAAPVVTSPPTTAAATGPQIVSYSIPSPVCPGQVGLTATWNVTGADTVYFAIDGPGVYEYVGPSGSTVLPFTCGDPQEYFLVAVKDGQQVIRSKTRGP